MIPGAVQRRQPGQAIAEKSDGDSRHEPGLRRPRRHDNTVDILPALGADLVAGPVEHSLREHFAQVVTVEPFHLHHANPAPFDEVMDVNDVVALDQRHASADLPHPRHVLEIQLRIMVRFG